MSYRCALSCSIHTTYYLLNKTQCFSSKGDKKGKARIELDVGEIPSPINEISCLSESLCFPSFNGVYVNPTSRLAFIGKCIELCEGELSYEWTISSQEYIIETVR